MRFVNYFTVTLCTVFLASILVSSNPASNIDCKLMLVQLRELQEILKTTNNLEERHELLRKRERFPSLRLRFGKRFDPLRMSPDSSNEALPY